jgi:glycosyltransferase involved in cell wall biosynthesis
LLTRIWRNLVYAVRSAQAQYKLMDRGDSVHFMNPVHFPLGFAAYAVVWLRGGNIVLTAHDPLPHRWRFPGILQKFEKYMLGVAYRMSDSVVVHNAVGREVLVREFGVDRRRIQVIPHGPIGSESGQGEYPGPETLNLLAFGAIRENKGLLLAIRAVQNLRSKVAIPIQLTIRGELYTASEETYWNECLAQIAKAPEGIDAELRFVEEGEIAGLFAKHHAVILPYTEFFSESGVAALAVSRKRPIMATAAGGLGDMMRDLQCGIVIESAETAAVEQAILKAIEMGRDGLKQMGERGESALRSSRSWDSIGRRTADVYRSVAGPAGSVRKEGMTARPAGNPERFDSAAR